MRVFIYFSKKIILKFVNLLFNLNDNNVKDQLM